MVSFLLSSNSILGVLTWERLNDESESEIELSNKVGFINWCIGNRVLRTETAPIVALSILNYNLTA